MIAAYYRFESLPQQIKEANGIKSPNRLDCVAVCNPGGYAGLNVYANRKGMLFFYLVESRNVVEADSKRIATYTLSNGDQNLTSLHYENPAFDAYCLGYPNGRARLNDGTPNPAFPYRHDAYLFVCDWQKEIIELLVITSGKPFISDHYARLIDGEYEEELQRLRGLTQLYFPYRGL